MKPSMKFPGWIAALSMAVLLTGSASAADQRAKQIDRLLEISGTEAMIQSFIDSVSQQTALRAFDLAEGQGPFVRESFEAVFAPEGIRKKVSEALLDDFEAAHVEAALSWFESDLGRRLQTAEASAKAPASEQALLDFIAAFQSEPPNPDRLDVAVRIDQGRRGSALALNLLSEFMRGIMRATAAVSTLEGAVPTQDEVDTMVNEQIGPLGPLLQSQMVTFYLFMGRNFSLEENRRYLAHLESDAGRWFYNRTGDGMIRAMSRSGRAFGIHVAAQVETLRGEAEGGPAEAERSAVVAEARTFAASRNRAACLDEVDTRRRACLENTCYVLTNEFATTCFEVAQASVDLCVGVPSSEDPVVSIFWRADRCEARGTNDSACNAAHGALQGHCAKARATK